MTGSAWDHLAERLHALRAPISIRISPRAPPGLAAEQGLGIELGQQVPSRDDLDRRIDAVAADPVQLHQLLDEVHVQTVSGRGATLGDLEDADEARHLTEDTVVARFVAVLDALRERALSGTEAIACRQEMERSLS